MLSGFHRLKPKLCLVRGFWQFSVPNQNGCKRSVFKFCGYNDKDPFLRHQINHRAGTFPDCTRQPRWHMGLVWKRPWLLDTAQNHCPNLDFLSLWHNLFHFGTGARQELWRAEQSHTGEHFGEAQECNPTSARGHCGEVTSWCFQVPLTQGSSMSLPFPRAEHAGASWLHLSLTSRDQP